MLCYDITNRKSFDNLDHWSNELLTNMEKVPTLLLGNKIDLEEGRQVSYEEASEYAKNNGFLYFEVSGLKNEGDCVNKAIGRLVEGWVISYNGGGEEGFGGEWGEVGV